MKTVLARTSFKRDLKLPRKRGLDRTPLDTIIDLLRRGETLPPTCRDRQLKGEWRDWRECHIRVDWLLIYRTTATELYRRCGNQRITNRAMQDREGNRAGASSRPDRVERKLTNLPQNMPYGANPEI